MDLQTYILDLDRRQALADALGRSPDYLYQIGVGWRGRRPSPELAADIENATRALRRGVVRAEGMRPDCSFRRDRKGNVVGWFRQLNVA